MFNLLHNIFMKNTDKENNNNKNEEKIDYIIVKKDFENNECIICLDDMKIGDNIKILKCGHIYHHKCINDWFNVKKECPICCE